MNIAGMRVRITIQKNETVVDENANHLSAWRDYFSCWATAANSGRSVEEKHNAESTQEGSLIDFTVRWCSETAAVNSKQYRILLDGQIYDIRSIDEMEFGKRGRKLHAELVER